MSKYIVLSALKRDGKKYVADDSIELTKEKAKPLLANGTIAEAKANTENES